MSSASAPCALAQATQRIAVELNWRPLAARFFPPSDRAALAGAGADAAAALPTLIGEITQMLVLAGLMWGGGDITLLLFDAAGNFRAELTAEVWAAMTGQPVDDPTALIPTLDEQQRTVLRVTPDRVLFNE